MQETKFKVKIKVLKMHCKRMGYHAAKLGNGLPRWPPPWATWQLAFCNIPLPPPSHGNTESLIILSLSTIPGKGILVKGHSFFLFSFG